MTFDTLQQSRYIIKILAAVGLWTNLELRIFNRKMPQIPPILYKFLIHTPMTFTFTTLMWLDVFFSTDLTHATDVLYIALTETALVIKILSIWYHGALAKSIFNEWQTKEIFKLQTLQEHLMWQRSFKVFGWVTFWYTTCSLSVPSMASIRVLFVHTYQLPFPMWTPFDWQDPSYYWYAYIYEIIAMPLTCLANCALDMFQCYMMQHLAMCFKVIALRLENLGMKKFETNKKITKRLVEIIELDKKVKRMSQQTEWIVSYPILSQILLSAFIVCFSLYRLQKATDLGFVSVAFQYIFVMVLQIFLPCYYANNLTIESSRLNDCIYNCNWPELSAYNRKIIFIYMTYLQKPVIIKAGNFFDVGLPIFSKTMNNAYSFFALLINMDVE